jgi:hypothetical protein
MDLTIVSVVRPLTFQNMPIGSDETVGRKKVRRIVEPEVAVTVPAISSPLGKKRGAVEER